MCAEFEQRNTPNHVVYEPANLPGADSQVSSNEFSVVHHPRRCPAKGGQRNGINDNFYRALSWGNLQIQLRGAGKVPGLIPDREERMKRQRKIRDCMKQNVFFVKPDTTVIEAAAVLVERRVGTLPVVDDAGILIGVTSIKDIIQIFLPDFVSLLSDIDFVRDYGALEYPSSERLEKAKDMLVTDIMEEPLGIEDDSSLIKALSVMQKHGVRDLPVLKRGILVGIASRVDIGRAFLIDWQITQAENPKEL